MRKYLFPLCISLFSIHSSFEAVSQVPTIEWQKCFGGTGNETAFSIQQTSDGGYIVAGSTTSNDGNVIGYHDSTDAWVIKIDASGLLQWQNCLGGSGYDVFLDVHPASDGGYFLSGSTTSNNGDVSGNHGDRDFWVVKLDINGNLLWQRCLGGTDYEEMQFSYATSDSGFIGCGYAVSTDGDITNPIANGDYWLVKLDRDGNLEWDKSLGGSGYDFGVSVAETADQGYIVTGDSESNDGNVSGNHGSGDLWMVKTDNTANIEWQHCFGGSSFEEGIYVRQCADNGYISIGLSSSNDGDVSGNHGIEDFMVIKTDSSGNLQWINLLGGSDFDFGITVEQTLDYGFIAAGYTLSSDGDVTGFHGGGDGWLIKLDSSGNLMWQRCLGGTAGDFTFGAHQTNDGGYIVCGFASSIDGDVSGNLGGNDFWVVKLSPDEPTGVFNSPSDNLLWISPNPSSLATSLFFNLVKSSNVTIQLCNANGQILQTLQQGIFEKGNHSIEINTASMSPGIYFVRFLDNQSTLAKKLVVN